MKNTPINKDGTTFSCQIKTIRVMKISTILLFLNLTLHATNSFTQEDTFSYNFQNVPLKTFLTAFEKESNYKLLYREDYVEEEIVTLSCENAGVNELLAQLLRDTETSYQLLSNKLIVITPKNYQDEEIIITGRIVDEETGEGLPGVNITIKGTTTGTITGADGSYSIKLPGVDAVLVFSYIGYISKEATYSGEKEINIGLASDVQGLEEIVVIGYGQTQNKRNVSTAVSKISSQTISTLPVSRPEAVLQGSTPGISVMQNSGSPGSPLTIRLRGVGTAGTSQPLYLVDGVQVPDLSHLNPSDIDNISILKDAAASAIYGSRGGNGVVLVQTKRGKRIQTEPLVTMDGYYGVQNLARKPDLMSRDQYVDYYNEFAASTGGKQISEELQQNLEDTDWYDEVFDDNQPIQQYSLSIGDGGEKYAYYLSTGIFDQQGMVGGEADKSNYNRINVKGNFDYDLFDNLNVRLGTDIVRIERNYLFENQAGTGNAVMNYIPAIPAIYPVYDQGGNPYDMGNQGTGIVNGDTLPFGGVGAVTNPALALKHGNNRVNTDLTIMNVAANWNIIENLTLSGSYAYYRSISYDKQFTQAFDYQTDEERSSSFLNQFASYREIEFRNVYTQFESNLKYRVTQLGNEHDLQLMAGTSVLESSRLVKGQNGVDFYVNDFDRVNMSFIKDPKAINQISPQEFESGLLSFYGRANYAYRSKYLVGVTVRSDASSRFNDSNRTGFFPSVSLGWNLSEESFLQSLEIISLLKLRGSWGVNGNDNIGDYQFYNNLKTDRGPSFNGENTQGTAITVLPNSKVKWEEVAQTNIGVDINLFNNSLGITLDYYNKKTSDMLVPIGTPVYTGKTSAYANVADVKNSGFEAMVAYKRTILSDLKVNIAGNIGSNKNEVTGLGDNGQPLYGGNIGFIFADPITKTDIGEPIASFYGYEFDKVDDEGNLIFVDQDGKPGITEDDKTYIGNPFPDFTYGVSLGFEYKGFDFNAFLFGSHGNDIYDATVRLDAPYANRPVSYTGSGAPKNYLGGTTDSDQTQVSSFYVKDGSFAKLKTITLGYNLPKSIIENIGISKLRFYATAQNLFVITKYKGLDPEIGQAAAEGFGQTPGSSVLDVGIDRGFYPQPRVLMFGFQANF